MKKFEYQIHLFTSHECPLNEQSLNHIGEEGWELITITPFSADLDSYSRLKAVFKREIK